MECHAICEAALVSKEDLSRCVVHREERLLNAGLKCDLAETLTSEKFGTVRSSTKIDSRTSELGQPLQYEHC